MRLGSGGAKVTITFLSSCFMLWGVFCNCINCFSQFNSARTPTMPLTSPFEVYESGEWRIPQGPEAFTPWCDGMLRHMQVKEELIQKGQGMIIAIQQLPLFVSPDLKSNVTCRAFKHILSWLSLQFALLRRAILCFPFHHGLTLRYE